MKNIHLLPTNQSHLSLNRKYTDYMIGTDSGEPYWVYTKSWLNNMSCTDDSCVPHNMYITSDEEIKERDWFYDEDGELCKYTPDYKADPNIWFDNKKIILTTDQDLIKDGVQAIDDEFLEWFVKNPSCESVDVESMVNMIQFTSREFIHRIIIPKEELKTSEEWQKQFPDIKVIDPDGWDRKNYQYSWFEEKITLIEYTSRLYRSTVKGIIPKEEPKQETLKEAAKRYTKEETFLERLEDELKSQKELYTYSRNQVHELMCKAFKAGYKKHDVVEAGLEHLDTEVECSWILTRFDSTPK